MLDRASTFADKEIIETLKTRFVPVALDQAYQRRQKDAEGDFYRRIAGQGPRNNFEGTTQGLYVAGPDGAFLGYTNNRGPNRVKRMIDQALSRYEPSEVAAIDPGAPDSRYNPVPPDGGLIVQTIKPKSFCGGGVLLYTGSPSVAFGQNLHAVLFSALRLLGGQRDFAYS